MTLHTNQSTNPRNCNKEWQICKIIVNWIDPNLSHIFIFIIFYFHSVKLRSHCADKRSYKLGRARNAKWWDNFLLMLFNAVDVILDILITNHFRHQQKYVRLILALLLISIYELYFFFTMTTLLLFWETSHYCCCCFSYRLSQSHIIPYVMYLFSSSSSSRYLLLFRNVKKLSEWRGINKINLDFSPCCYLRCMKYSCIYGWFTSEGCCKMPM